MITGQDEPLAELTGVEVGIKSSPASDCRDKGAALSNTEVVSSCPTAFRPSQVPSFFMFKQDYDLSLKAALPFPPHSVLLCNPD